MLKGEPEKVANYSEQYKEPFLCVLDKLTSKIDKDVPNQTDPILKLIVICQYNYLLCLALFWNRRLAYKLLELYEHWRSEYRCYRYPA